MATTFIGLNADQAVQRWSARLFVDMAAMAYWTKFEGTSENSIVHEKVDLKRAAGERILFDLSVRLRGKPTKGDENIVGREEKLTFYQDDVYIDQVRHSVSAGGAMSRQRTLHNLRTVARDRLAEWFAEWRDELYFAYCSGMGPTDIMNEDSLLDGPHAGNAFQAPDAAHIMYAGGATSKASITTSDILSRDTIERVKTRADMMNATDPRSMNLRGVQIEGGEHFVFVMNPHQEYDLRKAVGDGSWLDIQKAAAGAEGRDNPIFKGKSGMLNNVVLHCHKSIRRYDDAGAAQNLPAARALFLGRQAMVVAYGNGSGKTRMNWREEDANAGNDLNVYCGMIFGVTKTRFDDRDFGVIAVDTYSAAVT